LVSIVTKPIYTIDSTTTYASFMMESMEEASSSNCSSSNSDDDVVATVVRTTAAVAASIAATTNIFSGISHSGKVYAYSDGTQVRKKRRVFDNAGGLHCIKRDFFWKRFPSHVQPLKAKIRDSDAGHQSKRD
jgi:hypothetical protein